MPVISRMVLVLAGLIAIPSIHVWLLDSLSRLSGLLLSLLWCVGLLLPLRSLSFNWTINLVFGHITKANRSVAVVNNSKCTDRPKETKPKLLGVI
jgi:ABC-type multidrug transport system fused ATPase/permease subunit